jgi:integrase
MEQGSIQGSTPIVRGYIMAMKKNPKKQYSGNTKRHLTKFPGVYERHADRLIGVPDVCFDISYKVDGKKVWEKVGWKSQGYTPELVRQIRNERIITIQHGDELPQQKQKSPYFKDIAMKYLEWASENKARQGRDDSYLYKKHLSRYFDNKRLQDISPFDLERMKSDLTKIGLSPASVKHCLVLFRQIINKAIAWRMFEGQNPVKEVKLPIVQNQRERFLKHEEAYLLLNELAKVKSSDLHDMALLSLHCGLRASEIFKLKGQDLDFDNGIINVSDTKNKLARKAYMTAAVRDILQKRKSVSLDELIFKDKRNNNTITAISQKFRIIVNKLGFNKGITDPRHKVYFHTLRHTFASWLAIEGTPLYTIAQLMGHKSIAMSERYSHLSPDHKKQAISSLENVIQKKKEIWSMKESIR